MGEDAARNEFIPFVKTLETLVQELSLFRKNMYPQVEREMVQMVMGLATKIIQTDLASREDSIRDIIHLAVGSILDRETMVIKVNPKDHVHIEHYSPILERLYPDINNLRFEASASVDPGGCIVQSNFGSVEASLDTLNKEIEVLLNITTHASEEKLGEELDPGTILRPTETTAEDEESGEPEAPSASSPEMDQPEASDAPEDEDPRPETEN